MPKHEGTPVPSLIGSVVPQSVFEKWLITVVIELASRPEEGSRRIKTLFYLFVLHSS